MRIVLDQVDGALYGDIILAPHEIDAMKMGDMIDGHTIFNQKCYYIGVRINSLWDNDEEENHEEENWFD